ncbi:MAG: hypothetical protein FJ290_14385 [Planctomycetes bacterium]|nr:hypothetical protein [Planctomycetota bacterium]
MRTKLVAVVCALAGALWGGERRAPVLEVSKGVMPDSVPDGVKGSLDERPELGGVCLKVVLDKATWFADCRAKDWSRFAKFKFDVLNPAQAEAKLNVTLKHRGSTTYDNRVDVPLLAKPGKSTCEVDLAGVKNNNGTAPDLTQVKIWSVDGPAGSTLYFGDFYLEGEVDAAAAAEPKPAAPGQGIRITGTIDVVITGLGDTKITIAPKEGGAPAAPAAPQPAAAGKKAVLWGFTKGELPRDSANVKSSLTEDAKLGGVCLKAEFAKDSFFADWALRIKDWRPFASLKFTAVNPGDKPVTLALTIKHKGTTGYDTRVDRSFALAPGKNELEVALTGIANNDGTAADLSEVKMLTIACGEEATILFGDFILGGGQ